MNRNRNITPRKGIHDMGWNAFMVSKARFSPKDIPLCQTTAEEPPEGMLTYKEAKTLYHKELRKGNKEFWNRDYVCFYEDDQDFDSTCGIWYRPSNAYRVLKHFGGIITPDFSTYQDFPAPLKIWNTYRMRAFGNWYGNICGNHVINNVRWGTPETYNYCFEGIPRFSMVAIGTVGGSPQHLINRKRFESGLDAMMKVLCPHTILVYGSDRYTCFDRIKRQGVTVISYPGKTCRAFAEAKK